MIVYDTLSELESYISIIPGLMRVIDVMDHSTPYDDNSGEYQIPGLEKGKYIVDSFLTSDKGSIGRSDGSYTVEIVLEGEEMVRLSDSVFRLSEGVFLAYKGEGEEVVRSLSYSLPSLCKSVRFILP